MLLSWNGETTPDIDLETEIRAAHAAGFGGIEIFVPKLAPYLACRTVRDLGRALRDANLVPVSLNGLENINLRTHAEFAQVRDECARLASVAAECGCRDLVVVPSPRPAGMSDDAVVEQSADALRELADIAAPFGVTLAFEFLGPATCSVRTLALAQRIVERAASVIAGTFAEFILRNEGLSVNSAAKQSPNRDSEIASSQSFDSAEFTLSNVEGLRSGSLLAMTRQPGIVFDTFHFFVGGSAMEEIDAAATRLIRLVHINDVESKPREALTDADRLLPGEGVLPLGAMLGALVANGYDGAYSLEVMRPAYRARELGEYMADARRKVEAVVKASARRQ